MHFVTHYPIYLEIADDGRCMAHVLDLPGCVVRAPNRDETLARVPDAIRDYHAWLRRHGEPAPPKGESVEIEIAGESDGAGPFDRRSAAALFPPEQEPIAPEKMARHMARHFHLMAHTRADLLALVRDLPDDVLDWRPHPGSFTLRGLLRHVGNGEQWYVSRLVPPETLPEEWTHDEDLPILAFLDMTRRTAVARLQQLTEVERCGIFYPTERAWTPGEPWTVRKALRRFLEHEREHTVQAQEILAAWRAHLLARLAAERAGLLEQLLGLDAETLTESPVFDGWTAKDLLAHVAGWDELFTVRIELVLAGREMEMGSVSLDTRNAALYTKRKDWPLKRALEACVTARADFLMALARLPEQEFHRRLILPWGEASVRRWTQWRARHDAAHAADLATWRQGFGERSFDKLRMLAQGRADQGLESKIDPKEILLAALNAGREELLAAAALVPPEEQASRPVCGKEWTLKDTLGHVADWEWLGVDGLRHIAAGQAPQVERVEDIEAWNQAHAEARRGQPWEVVWADLHGARQALLEVLEGMSQADLARSFPFSWGSEDTAYQWVCVFVAHDRSHARDVRSVGAEP